MFAKSLYCDRATYLDTVMNLSKTLQASGTGWRWLGRESFHRRVPLQQDAGDDKRYSGRLPGREFLAEIQPSREGY